MFNGILDGTPLPEWASDATGILVLIWMSITVYKFGAAFHENEFVRKRSQRLEEASKTDSLSDEEEQFLENSKMVERLGMTTKIKCTPNQARLVQKLYNTGEFPIAVLKPTLPYLSLVDGKVKANMDRLDTGFAYGSGLLALSLLIYGYYLTFKLDMYGGDLNKLIGGGIVFGVYALLSLWSGRAFKTKRSFDWAVDKLKDLDLYYEAPPKEATAEERTAHPDMISENLDSPTSTEPV